MSLPGYSSSRTIILTVAKLLMLTVSHVPLLHAAPLEAWFRVAAENEGGEPTSEPTLWIYLTTAVVLVLLGGAFAGLTIALMGQDDVNLQVIQASGEEREKRHAGRVLGLLKKGKHWVLVTLLLGNVITNETLPIVLDRSLGGGWPAVLGSTALIVIFGEIIPQSICVRYGLPIGAWMSPLVLMLMYILGPVAWPTAKLLDWLLGEEHGNVYKKAGLKTLVDLHKTLGTSPHERLNQDEVTIISAVLDLKDKSVGSIMTPIEDVFTIPSDTVLDEKTMDTILSAGYSRIPIFSPELETNFVGMLLVKILITYDPEDCKRVSDFALATLPETRPETSCLDIVNFFQEGKSHMVLVSNFPGEDHGALGVVTLEDVIEELIGEEIIDESDVFVDVHKAIRRITPAPKARLPKNQAANAGEPVDDVESEDLIEVGADELPSALQSRHASLDGSADARPKAKPSMSDYGASPRNLGLQRPSTLLGSSNHATAGMKVGAPDMFDQLKHLGPSNLASRPRTTRYNTVKIKPGGGGGGIEETGKNVVGKIVEEPSSPNAVSPAPQGGIGTGLVTSAGKDASDGVFALQAGYGSIASPPASSRENESPSSLDTTPTATQPRRSKAEPGTPVTVRKVLDFGKPSTQQSSTRHVSTPYPTTRHVSTPYPTARSTSTHHADSTGSPYLQPSAKQGSMSVALTGTTARSGSITENVVHAGGVRKVILETTSGSSDEADEHDGVPAGEPSSRNVSTSNVNTPAPRNPSPTAAGSDEAVGSPAATPIPRPGTSIGANRRRRRRRKHRGGSRDDGDGDGGKPTQNGDDTDETGNRGAEDGEETPLLDRRAH